MIYEIEFTALAWRLLPPLFRKNFWLSFARLCLEGVKVVHDSFLAFRLLSLKNVTYTNQAVSLEAYLQNELHPSIYIEDNTNAVKVEFVYTEIHAQNTPQILTESHGASVPVFTEQHFTKLEDFAFTVFVPAFINKDLVRSIVDRVNLLSITYQIEEL